jgi:hypothetical protein
LAPGLCEGQVPELVKDDDVFAAGIIGHAPPFSGAGLGLEPADQIDDIEEPPAGAGRDSGPGDGDGQMGLAGSGAADQLDIALQRQELPGRQVADQGLIDGGAGEVEVRDVLGRGQFGDGQLVFDRACLLFGDLGGEQV